MKSGVFTCLFAALLLFWLPVNSQNLLYDGDFSLTTDIEDNTGIPSINKWEKFIYDVDAEFAVIDGVCEIKINYPGAENWQAQLLQGVSGLEPGHRYNLTFDVKASSDCWFVVFLGEVNGYWTTFLNDYWYSTGTSWQTISLDFNVPVVFANHKLSFEFGQLYNTTIYFDNVIVKELEPYIPSAGVIGTAVNGGWETDVDMETTDGVIYTLENFPLSNGFMKFRLDDSWKFNWGNTEFPSGTGYQYGPDIPIPNPGNYDITLNIQTGEYSFVCVMNCLPFIGIIGTAVPPGFGSEPDVDLYTADGIIYKSDLIGFADGELVFRQDNSWIEIWGGDGFPIGLATSGGEPVQVQAGFYKLTFNIQTGEYHFGYPEIGILGSALNGWETDIDLNTTDGIIYTLSDYPFTDGYVKFRAENNWNQNWGGYEFPSGYAWLYGPDIPVLAGNYDVTFNLQTGEYVFEATSCPVPNIQCPYDVYLMAEPGSCEAVVYYSEVKSAANCGGEDITIEQIEGLPSGSVFPAGQTLNTFRLTNKDGNTAICSFYVVVMEPEPPVITLNVDSFEPLWPPDHKMVNFYLDYTVTDNCNTSNSYLYVWSNEPENGTGEGDKSPDWEIVDEHNVLLRAERSAKGTGREYYISIMAYDNSWNYDFKMITVKVPHDLGFAADTPAPKIKSAIAEKDMYNKLQAEIWPNPSGNYFNLKTGGGENERISVSVIDLTGRTIINFSADSNELMQFGEGLKTGSYIVSVSNKTERHFIRIVKKQ